MDGPSIPAQSPIDGAPGGGGDCLFWGRHPKTKIQTPDFVLPQPSLTVSFGLQPPGFEASKDSLLLLLLLLQFTSIRYTFSVILKQLLLNVIKTLVIANPGWCPWNRQAQNYCPDRVGPLLQPPSQSTFSF